MGGRSQVMLGKSILNSMWQIDINVVTFDTFETPVELGAHNF